MFSKSNGEFIVISNQIIAESVFFASGNQIFYAKCEEVTRTRIHEIDISTDRCTRDIPVTIQKVEEDQVAGYMNRFKIVSKNTEEVACSGIEEQFCTFLKSNEMKTIIRKDKKTWLKDSPSLLTKVANQSPAIGQLIELKSKCEQFLRDKLGIKTNIFWEGLLIVFLLLVSLIAGFYICFCSKNKQNDLVLFKRIVFGLANKTSCYNWMNSIQLQIQRHQENSARDSRFGPSIDQYPGDLFETVRRNQAKRTSAVRKHQFVIDRSLQDEQIEDSFEIINEHPANK